LNSLFRMYSEMKSGSIMKCARLRLRELHLLVALVVLLREIEHVLVCIAWPAVDLLLDEVALHHVRTFDLCTAAYTSLTQGIQTLLRFTT
jgi:hypothetical protein